MTDSKVSVLSLRRIAALPLDGSDLLLSHYPAMKLGVTEDLAFYARKLADRILRLIEASGRRRWTLTAPPYQAIPAAANLLAWQVRDLLLEELRSSIDLQLVDLRLPKSVLRIDDEADFKRYYQYSNNKLEDRVRERQKLQQGPDSILQHEHVLRGRSVIVVNDIKVTGTQQHFMQASFDKVGSEAVHWLYILEVAQDLAASYPQIESEINQLSIRSPAEFGAVLGSSSTRHTARCIARLFSHDVQTFHDLLERLGDAQRSRILELAQQEGRYDGAYFQDKLDLLKNLSTVT